MQTIELTENETEQVKLALLCYREHCLFLTEQASQPIDKYREVVMVDALLNKLGYTSSNYSEMVERSKKLAQNKLPIKG